jgi:hypothetical protein
MAGSSGTARLGRRRIISETDFKNYLALFDMSPLRIKGTNLAVGEGSIEQCQPDHLRSLGDRRGRKRLSEDTFRQRSWQFVGVSRPVLFTTARARLTD